MGHQAGCCSGMMTSRQMGHLRTFTAAPDARFWPLVEPAECCATRAADQGQAQGLQLPCCGQ
eukprot:5347816-Lingulodinium_polyedra.AAC.1